MSFSETLREFYDGEVLGEALYSAMAASASNERQRRIWGVLLQAETETKAWLRAPMLAAGLGVAESAEHRARGEAYAEGMAKLPWRDQIQRLQDAIDGQIGPRFASYAQAARDRGASDEEAVCRHMLWHEEAQVELTRRELAGAALDQVLAPVAAQLRYPLEA